MTSSEDYFPGAPPTPLARRHRDVKPDLSSSYALGCCNEWQSTNKLTRVPHSRLRSLVERRGHNPLSVLGIRKRDLS